MAALSGKITVTTAGTPVAGPSGVVGQYFMLVAPSSNTGSIWVGNDGAGGVDNAAGNGGTDGGIPVEPGTGIIIPGYKLSDLRFNADVSGEVIYWFDYSQRA